MNKYHNCKTVIDGIIFDSKREANRWQELKLMQRAGMITDLERQVKFEIIPKLTRNDSVLHRATHYIADFVYKQDGKCVVEDAKGVKTKEYALKKKLMYSAYGIEIMEV